MYGLCRGFMLKKKIKIKDFFVKENEKVVYILYIMKLYVYLFKFWILCYVLYVCYNIFKLNKEVFEICILECFLIKVGFLMF